MIVLQFLLVVFSFLLLAAHFLRAGALVMMLLSFGLLALVFVRQPWAARVLQAWLAIGALVWALTGFSLAIDRVGQGRPAVRLLVIMGSVALVTILAAVTIQRGAMARHFGLHRPDPGEPPPS
jgi:ABC-type transport system involved in cytochrome c biogenesis permease subunit